MAKSLYVASTSGFSGKTAICLGMAVKLAEIGYEVGYFKPIGWEMATREGKPIDEDTILMKEVLGLKEPLEIIAPVIVPPRVLEYLREAEKVKEKILNAYKQLSEGKDVVIVEGLQTPSTCSFAGLSAPEIAKEIKAPILLVSKVEDQLTVDTILRDKVYIESMGATLKGAILNYVPSEVLERVKDLDVKILEEKGVKIWGVIPENIELTAPTVREILEVLGGEVLTGEDKLDKIVEDFMVGAMRPELALRYFRRSVNKAVITGGDRADIALTALETSTSCLILTGNYYPSVRVLIKAGEKGVPVILVPYDLSLIHI